MISALLAVWLAGAPPAPPPPQPTWYNGRVYTSPSLRVGVRPALYVDHDETAVAVTLQVSARIL